MGQWIIIIIFGVFIGWFPEKARSKFLLVRHRHHIKISVKSHLSIPLETSMQCMFPNAYFTGCAKCKVFIKWASLIEINWIKFGLIK